MLVDSDQLVSSSIHEYNIAMLLHSSDFVIFCANLNINKLEGNIITYLDVSDCS